MNSSSSQSSVASLGSRNDVLSDRRRPGRAEVDPALVPLMRRSNTGEVVVDEGWTVLEGAELPEPEEQQVDGNLARGILFGVALSAPFWLGVAATWFFVFR